MTENYTEEYALYCRAAQVCFITQVCLFYSQWSWKTKSLNASWCFLSAQQNYPVWFGAGLMLNSFVGGWGVCGGGGASSKYGIVISYTFYMAVHEYCVTQV